MLLQNIFIAVFILFLLLMLGIFLYKAALQFQYISISEKKKATKPSDFFKFSLSDEKARTKRWKAFLMFPLMYAIVLDDKKEALLQIKIKIKRLHIAIYFILILLIVLGIFSEKVFPQNL